MRTRDPSPRRRMAYLACLLSALLLTSTACTLAEGEGSPQSGSSDGQNLPSVPRTSLTYVALGDSYSAAPLVPVTDVANGCFRSSNNYPSIVAKRLGAVLDDRSCGGARTVDFRRRQFPDVPAQLRAVKPGVDLVTIGVGGNDESVFSRLVNNCPALRDRDPEGAPCRAAMRSAGSDMLLTALDRTASRVAGLVREIRQRAPKAQVLVIGYPQIVSADDTCDELPLARGDYAYAEQVNLALTEMLRKAATVAKATYVDVWSASEGHDICADDPWINGALAAEQKAARYHPFAEEQRAVADLILRAVR